MGETELQLQTKPVDPPRERRKLVRTPKVTNLLDKMGKSTKDGDNETASGKPNIVSKSSESQVLERKKYWMEQINTLNAAIDKDIAALEMIPGQSSYASGFRKTKSVIKIGGKATVGDLQESHKALTSLQLEVHSSLTDAKGDLKEKFATTGKEREKYEKTHGKLEEIERQLDAYPAGASDLNAPDGAAFFKAKVLPQRQKAEVLFDKLHFEPALTEITEAYKTAKGHLEDLKGREGKLTGLLGVFKLSDTALKSLRQDIGKLTPLIGESFTQPFENIADGFYATMLRYAKSPPKGIDESTAKSIKDTQADLLKSTKEQITLRKGIDADVSRIEKVIQKDGAVQPQAKIDEVNTKLDKARELLATFSFAEARTAVDAASEIVKDWKALPGHDDPTRKETIGKTGYTEFFEKAETALDDARKQLILAATAPILETPPSVQSVIDMLTFQMERFKGAQDEFPIGVGLDTVKMANERNAENRKRYDEYLKLASVREDLGKKINALAISADDAIQNFKSMLTKAGTNANNIATYDGPYGRALDEWGAAMERGLTADDLNIPFKSVSTQLKDLAETARKDATDPERLISATTEAKVGQLDEQFRASDELAGAVVAKLGEADYDRGDVAGQQLETARKQYVAARKSQDIKAAQAAIKAIDKLTEEAKRHGETADQQRSTKIREFHEANDGISSDLARLSNAAKDDKCKAYTAVLEQIKQQQIMIGRVGKSSDPSVLVLAIADLEQLQKEIAKIDGLFKKLTTKGAKTVPGDFTIENLNKRLDDLKLKDDTVKTFEAKALTDITTKKTGIAGKVGKVLLTETDKAIVALDTEWKTLTTTAEKHKQEVTDFRNDVAVTLQDFAKEIDAKVYAAYAKSVTDRLKVLDTSADKEKQVDKKALEGIKAEIAKNKLGGSTTLKLANDGSETDELADQLAQKQWISDLAAFKGKLKALDEVGKNITDPSKKKAFLGQKKQTIDAVEEIKKRAKGTKGAKPPFATMSEQLGALVSNINNMIRYPMGLETHARGEILKTVAEWDKEVTKFHALLDTLVKTIDEAMGTDTQKGEVVTAINTRLKTLKEAVAPNTVLPWAKEVVEAADATAARAARELAMREVLRLTSLVQGTAFQPLGTNPFKVPVLEELSALSASLFDIQTNLTISL